MIMTALAIFGALLVAVTYRALWIGVRTAQGSRRPPEEWLKRNGFVWRDDGRWHRGAADRRARQARVGRRVLRSAT